MKLQTSTFNQTSRTIFEPSPAVDFHPSNNPPARFELVFGAWSFTGAWCLVFGAFYRCLAIAGIVLSLQSTVCSQSVDVIPLWSEGAPGALGNSSNDVPTLTVYLPDTTNAPTAAFVICPGGAYGRLARHEGEFYARWLNEQGIAGFVLKYRLGSAGYRHPAMLQDAARALRTVRARAAEWNVDPARIGIMGSSAGGHLASTLLTHFDAGDTNSTDAIERVSSRPDGGILCYPVISMGKYAHAGSRANLLGTNPPPELIAELSNELQVTTNTPPCFIWHTWEDTTVAVENSLQFAAALRAAGVRFDLHIYERGGHGLGLGVRDNYDSANLLPWTQDCAHWLKG
ncbi:MAG TPA: alpha/beta hydrolase, partial [Verrucomicrobiota bacterium]|nr:alpha/beta hydrolase [Verrucomicrobiota bacterium]